MIGIHMISRQTTDITVPCEQCQRGYRYCTLQQAWSQIPISGVDPGNERGRALLNAMITRSFQSASDNAAGELLELF